MKPSRLFLISALALGAVISPVLRAQDAEPSAAELKKEIVSLRAEVEKLKTEKAAAEKDEGENEDGGEEEKEKDDGTPSDLSPLHIFGKVDCDLGKLKGLSSEQLAELKEWRLLRLGEWNAGARIALAENPGRADDAHGPAHWRIDLHWSLVRKSGGVTTVCCHVFEDWCGAHPINSVYAFTFTGDTAAVVTPRKLFAGSDVLPALRALIEKHRHENTDRLAGAAAEDPEETSEEQDGEAVEEAQDGDAGNDAAMTEESDDEEDAPADEIVARSFAIDWYKLTQIAVTEDSLLFCFDQGEIGPMAYGALVIPVPVAELLELLSPEGRALFGKR